MSLTVLLGHRVIELEGPQTSTRHQQEGDVLDVIHLFGIGVLRVEVRSMTEGADWRRTPKILRISLFPTTTKQMTS